MKIFNLTSFGASLNTEGELLVNRAKTIAKNYDAIKKNNNYSNILKNSLSVIDEFMPDEQLNIKYDKTNYALPLYIVRLGSKAIFKHGGDEFDFITDFAKTIKNGIIV